MRAIVSATLRFQPRLNLKSRVRRSLHHAIIPSHYLRSHGGGFASLAFPFFRADQLTAILLSGLTIALMVARLGDDDSRSQHDHNNRADDRINGEQGKGGKRSVRKALYAMKSFRNDPVAAQEKATEIVEMIEELNQNIINLHNALLKQRQKADKEATAKVGKAKTKSKAKTKCAPRMVK